DGEPSGTAGMPMLDALQKLELKNTVAVVTRYFGGIKLGAGGLIRAYSSATSETIKHRSEEHTSELQSRFDLVCRLLLKKKKINQYIIKKKKILMRITTAHRKRLKDPFYYRLRYYKIMTS